MFLWLPGIYRNMTLYRFRYPEPWNMPKHLQWVGVNQDMLKINNTFFCFQYPNFPFYSSNVFFTLCIRMFCPTLPIFFIHEKIPRKNIFSYVIFCCFMDFPLFEITFLFDIFVNILSTHFIQLHIYSFS